MHNCGFPFLLPTQGWGTQNQAKGEGSSRAGLNSEWTPLSNHRQLWGTPFTR